jgi:Kef-type K+ transport system membrane component KefB
MTDAHSMPLIVMILFLLVAARAGGELMERLGQPAMVGEIFAGIFLGPSFLNLARLTPELAAISELGVFFLIMLAGMEIDPREMGIAVRGRGAWVPLMGFAVPLAMGMGVGLAFRLDATRIVFLGLCIAITALPVSVRILLDLGKLNTPIGQKIVSSALANDVASLLVLGILLNVRSGPADLGGFILTLLLISVKVLLFMAVILGTYRLVRYSTGKIPASRKILNNLLGRLQGKETLFALTLVFVLIFAGLSEAVGLHFVIGAFFGALLISREILGVGNFQEVQRTTAAVGMGFLAPVFFATIGLVFDFRAFLHWPLLTAVLAAAFAGKIAGGYAGGRLAGLTRQESGALGIGLNARGIMELVIANIALSKGFIGPGLFSILVVMGVATTMVTPILLKNAFRRLESPASPDPIHA